MEQVNDLLEQQPPLRKMQMSLEIQKCYREGSEKQDEIILPDEVYDRHLNKLRQGEKSYTDYANCHCVPGLPCLCLKAENILKDDKMVRITSKGKQQMIVKESSQTDMVKVDGVDGTSLLVAKHLIDK